MRDEEQLEVEKRMGTLRAAQPQNASTLPPAALSAPVLYSHTMSSGSSSALRPAILAAQPGASLALSPPIFSSSPALYNAPTSVHIPKRPWLTPRDTAAPHLVPFSPPMEQAPTEPPTYTGNKRNHAIQEDGEDDSGEHLNYHQRAIEVCLGESYHFGDTFHVRGIHPFRQKRWGETNHAQRNRINKRYQYRLKENRTPARRNEPLSGEP